MENNSYSPKMNLKIFRGYDNPKEAIRVWKVYEADMPNAEIRQKAKEIVFQCNSVEDLDLRLDKLLEESTRPAGRRPSLDDINKGTSGGWMLEKKG